MFIISHAPFALSTYPKVIPDLLTLFLTQAKGGFLEEHEERGDFVGSCFMPVIAP
jgi:hypothetical protein